MFLADKFQMTIEVSGDGNGAVSQPPGYIDQRHSGSNQKCGAGVTKIMESDMWQVICLENSREVCSHKARLDDFTNLIDIDVVKVSPFRV